MKNKLMVTVVLSILLLSAGTVCAKERDLFNGVTTEAQSVRLNRSGFLKMRLHINDESFKVINSDHVSRADVWVARSSEQEFTGEYYVLIKGDSHQVIQVLGTSFLRGKYWHSEGPNGVMENWTQAWRKKDKFCRENSRSRSKDAGILFSYSELHGVGEFKCLQPVFAE
jgi:hypothetical protein